MAVKSFGISAGSVAFHPAQPHEREKSFLVKPTLGPLGLERIHNDLYLPLILLRLKWNKHVRPSHVAVVLRNFIFQNHMISKRIPGQLPNQTMILMSVPSVVREDEIGRNWLQLLKSRF